MDDPMALLHEADSELTKCYNMRNADARMVRLHWKTMPGGLFKLPITSLFVVKNIKCGYSFSWLELAEHFETKIEQIVRNFLFCNKSASQTA